MQHTTCEEQVLRLSGMEPGSKVVWDLVLQWYGTQSNSGMEPGPKVVWDLALYWYGTQSYSGMEPGPKIVWDLALEWYGFWLTEQPVFCKGLENPWGSNEVGESSGQCGCKHSHCDEGRYNIDVLQGEEKEGVNT